MLLAAEETKGWGEWVAGVVPGKGMEALEAEGSAGVFLGARGEVLLVVLPVRDAQGFAAAVGATATAEGWELGGLQCLVKVAGWMCAPELAAIDAALAATARPLRDRVRGLPAALRGQLELAADLSGMPDMAGVRKRLGAVIEEARLVTLALRFTDGIGLRLWIEGRPVPPWTSLLAAPAPHDGLDGAERGAPGGLRWKFELARLMSFALPPAAVPDRPDLGAVLARLFTGDVLLATRGRGRLAGELLLGLADPAGVRAALPGLCRNPLGALGRVDARDDGCTIVLEAAPEWARDPLARAALELTHGTPLQLAVDGDLLRVTAGDVLGGPQAPPPRALAREPWQLRGWSVVPDPMLAMTPATRARVDARLAELSAEGRARLAAVRWVLDHVGALGLGLRFDDRGFHLLATIDPLAADAPAAAAAWREALAVERAGDLPGFRAHLTALRAAHPGSRAAAQAALILDGTPALGPAGALGAAAIAPAIRSRLDSPPRGGR